MTDKLAYDFDLRLDDAVSTHALQFRMVPEGARVLDVGCHTGILGEALRSKKHCSVTGLDHDPQALAVAQRRLDDVVGADLEATDWQKSLAHREFDCILFGDVIEHTREPLKILREAREFLSPIGCIMVSLPNVANLRVRLELLRGRFEYADSGILDKSHLRFFTLKSARRLVEQAGYRILRETYSGYSLPRWLIDLFPTLFAVNIILLAEPKPIGT